MEVDQLYTHHSVDIIFSKYKGKRVKGPDIYIPPLTGKPEQLRLAYWKWRTDQH